MYTEDMQLGPGEGLQQVEAAWRKGPRDEAAAGEQLLSGVLALADTLQVG